MSRASIALRTSTGICSATARTFQQNDGPQDLIPSSSRVGVESDSFPAVSTVLANAAVYISDWMLTPSEKPFS